MGDLFNPDFQEFLKLCNKHEVDYVLVGGYAVNFHGYHRTTADMDLYVEASSENYKKIVAVFSAFGMPLFDMTEVNFLNLDDFDVFVFGRAPVRIELITKIKGLDYSLAKRFSRWGDIDGVSVNVLTRKGLFLAKEKAGRFKDLEDIKRLGLSEDE